MEKALITGITGPPREIVAYRRGLRRLNFTGRLGIKLINVYFISRGQDGSYLAELLIENGYEVHGIIRFIP